MSRLPRRFTTLSTAAAVLMVNAVSFAQDHGHAAADHADHAAAHAHEPLKPLATMQQGLITGITAIVVFALVLAVLALKVWPTISKGLDERSNKIRNEIEAAEMAQRQASQALEEYKNNLAKARAEAQKMLDTAKSQQVAIAADLKAKSEIELNSMREKATRDIESAKRAALAEIYDAGANRAIEIAAKILKREINANDQQRLVQESLSELQAVVAGSN